MKSRHICPTAGIRMLAVQQNRHSKQSLKQAALTWQTHGRAWLAQPGSFSKWDPHRAPALLHLPPSCPSHPRCRALRIAYQRASCPAQMQLWAYPVTSQGPTISPRWPSGCSGAHLDLNLQQTGARRSCTAAGRGWLVRPAVRQHSAGILSTQGRREQHHQADRTWPLLLQSGWMQMMMWSGKVSLQLFTMQMRPASGLLH